ncbi:hypothetical protein PF003_g41029 [Phytophthora fragariae]|nr:hypothetical protein PF003_g41029 [Phytophthora fragariae]
MRIMELKLLGSLTGPVQAPSSTANKLDAAMELLRLLEKLGFIAGAFDVGDLFYFAVDEIRISTESLLNLLKPLVGEGPAAKTPEPTAHASSCRSTTRDRPCTPLLLRKPDPAVRRDRDGCSLGRPVPQCFRCAPLTIRRSRSMRQGWRRRHRIGSP